MILGAALHSLLDASCTTNRCWSSSERIAQHRQTALKREPNRLEQLAANRLIRQQFRADWSPKGEARWLSDFDMEEMPPNVH